jgi:hypothetical protein
MNASWASRLSRLESLTQRALGSCPSPPTPGGGNETVYSMPFTWATLSQQLGAFPVGKTVLMACIIIDVAFNDPSATVSFGTTADYTLFVQAPASQPGQYATDAVTIPVVPDFFLLTMSPGASTAGSGTLLWVTTP